MAKTKKKKAGFQLPGNTSQVKIPERVIETVQDSVPIDTVHDKDNLIESYPGQYSRMYKISEINYQTLSEEEQEHIFERYRAFLNSVGSNTEIALTIHNRNIDLNSFEDSVLNKERGDDLDSLREQMNKIIIDRVAEGKNGIKTDKYITMSIHADDLTKAKEVFHRLDRDIDGSFSKLGSSAKPVAIEDRIDVLYDMYNPGHAGELLSRTKVMGDDGVTRDVAAFDFGNLRRMGISVADVLAPSSIVYQGDHIEIGDKYARVLTVTDYPSILGDDFLTSICAMNFNIVTTLNIKPISNAEADKIVGLNLTMVRAEKQKAQQKALKDGTSEDMISPAILERENEALNLRDDMREHDEHLFSTNLTMIVYADDLVALKEESDTIISEARKRSVTVQVATGIQDLAFATTLPLCYNVLKESRTFKSSSVAALLPFSVTELNDPNGINYSMNAVTRNLILYDRKSQFNSNGFILGTSGSGKSFAAKTEMLLVLLRTDDDVIVIDPESEYGPICDAVGGTTVRVMAGGKDRINPMDITVDVSASDEGDPVLDKVDFILNLCQIIVKSAWGMDSVQETIIDECIHQLYDPFYIDGPDGKKVLAPIPPSQMPTLTDLQNLITHRSEPEAREIQYALALYTGNGSLSIFGGKTTVDLDNRFIVYDINALGKKLKPVAMLIILDSIWQRIVQNRAQGRHTWFYIDEIYLLFKDEGSATFLQQFWKRCRKYGGCPTGLTQNVQDLLASDTACSMLANSSFIQMLNQAPTDRVQLQELLHLSESQADYITDAPRGQGLIYTGMQTVPFYSRFPKDNDVYRFLTSDIMEIKRYREEAYRKKLEEQNKQPDEEQIT